MLVLIPGLLLGLLAEHSGRRSLESLIGKQLSREAEHAAERLSALLESELELLEDFARQPVMREIGVLDLDKNIARALRALRAGDPSRVGYLLTDLAREPIASDDPRLLAAPPGWSRRSVEQPGVLGLVERSEAGPLLLLGTPVFDPEVPSERSGTLYALLDGSRLTTVTDEIRAELAAQGVSARIFVVDREGRLLEQAEGDGEPGVPLSRRRLERLLDATSSQDFRVDDESGWIVGRAGLSSPVTDWSVLVVEPLEQALAPVDALQRRLALIVCLALAVALVAAALSADRVIRPLRELTEAIRGLARPDASVRQVEVRSQDEVGSLATAFNEMARELDEAQRHLVEAEKFAFVGELAAGVAHQVRTSLGVLGSSAKMLARAYPEAADPASREMLEMIGAEVARLGRVVDDLLTLENGRSIDLRPVDLGVPLNAAIAFVQPQAAQKGVEIRVLPLRQMPEVACDREAIEQVFVNLLANALASLDRGRRIEVVVESTSSGSIRVSFRDDGEGIAPELVDRIFDPFVTGRADGVGLGLTFVKRIVHAHQWAIELVPHEGPGAWFRIELPSRGRSE